MSVKVEDRGPEDFAVVVDGETKYANLATRGLAEIVADHYREAGRAAARAQLHADQHANAHQRALDDEAQHARGHHDDDPLEGCPFCEDRRNRTQ